MDVIVRSNNNPVNDMTAPESGLINDLDKAIQTKSSQSLFGSFHLMHNQGRAIIWLVNVVKYQRL